MTLTLVPRPTDRAPKAKLHEGPYYGAELRRLLESDAKRSVDMEVGWLIAAIVVPAAVLAAALIVSL